ncbi:UBP-type zinc finger domain-containing protein [Leifsonia sp. L25]|uniref:UBP-type zinc finger domain-containing protein n=1 Tax=Leifsonia sp. L25 TaxID=3423957 RepID=UPI003D687BF6
MSDATSTGGIDPQAAPTGPGCAECMQTGDWWLHLRRCAECGHIGCCDDSLNTHASKHAESTGHPIIRSFEPGEDWFYDYRTGSFIDGPELAPPVSHPVDQTVPGLADRVPRDWERQLQQHR